MRNVIQIGLYKSAEWAFLTQWNWIEVMRKGAWRGDVDPKIYQLPEFYTQDTEPFRYFGLDISPKSISLLTDFYHDFENVNFITCGVGGELSVRKHLDEKYGDGWNIFSYEKANVLFLVMPFNMVIDALGVDNIAVLALDIDCKESPFFSTIDEWKVLPEFITMEIHEETLEFTQFLEGKYTDIGQIAHGDNYPNKTEARFMRTDIYEKHKESL